MVSVWMCSALVGALLGMLSGLGVGGGSLLMLYLTQILGQSQTQARALNLMFFLPCGLAATLVGRKRGLKPAKATVWAVVGGILGAWMGCFLQSRVETQLLRRGLGVLFLLTGIREITYRGKEFR